LIIINFFLVQNGYIPNYNHYFPLVNHFALFFGGIMFYKIATHVQSKLSGYAIIIFCLITQIIIFKFAGSDPGRVTQVQYTGMLTLYFLVFTLFIHEKLKFIVSKPTVFFGKISFALYLIHSFTFRGVIGFLQKHHFPFWIATACIAVPLAILLAYLITEYVEKPFSKKLKSFLKKKLLKSTPRSELVNN
jgi:peptidoglycan/LPS O-acetylase OafA/YrhL